MPSDGKVGLAELDRQNADRPARARLGDVIIDIRDLGLRFATGDTPVQALIDINLQVRAGEFVTLIGPSGCGKTTLLRIIADLDQPTSGQALVNGVSPKEARLNRAYGYVFQAAALYPWRNVQRNVELPHEIVGADKEKRAAIAKQYLDLVGLQGFERKFPWQLSGGMQQRVSIARALSFDPALLLMDEPFGALDEITRDRMNEELLRIWEKTKKTVIFVTHSIDEAVLLSTRIVVMSARPGRIVEEIESPLPLNRTLETRETPEAIALAHRVRLGLKAGHSYDA
jgi:NitT/TauT family transport system ATP-binding protein